MSRFTVTPWRTPADLHAVRHQLYRLDADGQDRRRTAVDRVLAWKLRGGNLPHAVESTALLVDAALHQAANVSGHSVRAVYTAAFTRFVTGFCDIRRARERMLEPSSMLQIARQIGMPPDFVALRHEATHEELPGLKRLVAATEQALAWLWQVYWGRLDHVLDDNRVHNAELFRKEVLHRLREVRRKRVDTLKQSTRQKQEASKADAGLGQQCIDTCLDSDSTRRIYSSPRVDGLVQIWVEEGLLMPSKRELGTSMNGAFLIWDRVLHEIESEYRGFCLRLAEGLLAQLDSISHQNHDLADSSECEGVVLWVLHLLDMADDASATGFGEKIARWCCMHPGYWARQLGRKLLSRVDDAFTDHWSDLLEASTIVAGSGTEDRPRDIAQEDIRQAIPGTGRSMGWRRAAAGTRKPIGVI